MRERKLDINMITIGNVGKRYMGFFNLFQQPLYKILKTKVLKICGNQGSIGKPRRYAAKDYDYETSKRMFQGSKGGDHQLYSTFKSYWRIILVWNETWALSMIIWYLLSNT